jgi:hypothetical protein
VPRDSLVVDEQFVAFREFGDGIPVDVVCLNDPTNVSTQVSVGVDECITADPHDDCYIFGTIAIVGSVTLFVIPEPSSSAAGAVYVGAVTLDALVGATAGTCVFTKTIDEHFASGCNYSRIEFCLDWSSSAGWDGVTWDLEITAAQPVNC